MGRTHSPASHSKSVTHTVDVTAALFSIQTKATLMKVIITSPLLLPLLFFCPSVVLAAVFDLSRALALSLF